jgi:hypothetical protein
MLKNMSIEKPLDNKENLIRSVFQDREQFKDKITEAVEATEKQYGQLEETDIFYKSDTFYGYIFGANYLPEVKKFRFKDWEEMIAEMRKEIEKEKEEKDDYKEIKRQIIIDDAKKQEEEEKERGGNDPNL